jgi:hypothetical protein
VHKISVLFEIVSLSFVCFIIVRVKQSIVYLNTILGIINRYTSPSNTTLGGVENKISVQTDSFENILILIVLSIYEVVKMKSRIKG